MFNFGHDSGQKAFLDKEAENQQRDQEESDDEENTPLTTLLVQQITSPHLRKSPSMFSSRSSVGMGSPAGPFYSNSHKNSYSREPKGAGGEEEEDDAPLSVLSRRESAVNIQPSSSCLSPFLNPNPQDLAPCIDCQALGYIHPNDRYACRTTPRCASCVTCRFCKGVGSVLKAAGGGAVGGAGVFQPTFSLMSLQKSGSHMMASGSAIMQAQSQFVPLPIPNNAYTRNSVGGEATTEKKEVVGTGMNLDNIGSTVDFFAAGGAGNVFGGADIAPISGRASVIPAITESTDEEDDVPLSIHPSRSPSICQRNNVIKYVIGPDGGLAEDPEGYTYAQPGTLLHTLPSVLEADKNKRPLDNRYGTGPLISFEVAQKSAQEHSKICNSLAYRTMIQAQEEQQINAMEKERQLNGRLPCEKCEGRGFSHPIDNLKIHDRAPTVECKFCRTCAICCGTGLFLDTTSCLDCQSLGYIHPNEPYSCRNTGACIGCISCKTCRGTGVHQKTGLTPRLSLVSLTASVASLAKKKNGGGIGGKSGSSVNIMRPRAASNGIVISSPSEFRKLAAGRMAENGGVSPSESRLFHHQNSGIIGDASDMVVSVSGILREAAALGDLPMRIPSAILAVPGAGRVPTRNQMDDDSRSLEGEENDDEDEDGSDDEERDVTADGDDLLKRLQEKEAMGSGSTLPEDAVFSNGP